jgi:FtsZ-binding cell division protein ZapB
MECEYCKSVLPKDGSYVTCNTCDKSSHFGSACSGLSERTWKAKSISEKEIWLCKNCRAKKLPRSPMEDSGGASDLQWGLAQVKETLEKIFSSQFELINNKLDQTLLQLDLALREVEELKSTNSALVMENSALKERIDFLTTDMNRLEQYSRSSNVEIHGYPEEENEDVEKVVTDICTKLDLEINSSDFLAHRIRKKKTGGDRPIIVQYFNRKIRNEVLSKGKRHKLKLNEIDSKFPDKPLYINENLSSYYKKLFFEAKKVKNLLNYKYLWVMNSKIFMKKNDDSKPIQVNSERDLDGLKQ